MSKYKLTGFPATYPEHTAEIFKKYDVKFELKRSGSIWVYNSYRDKYFALKRKFVRMICELFGHYLEYPVLDHERPYLTNNGTYITTFSPYSVYEKDGCWQKIVQNAHRFGLEVLELPKDEWFYSPSCPTYLIREESDSKGGAV